MKKYYNKVNQVYSKFMNEELKYFPKKNVFEKYKKKTNSNSD